MKNLLSLLRNSAGERNLRNALGQWRQEVSRRLDNPPIPVGGAVSQLVFRPGGVANGNVFTTWPTLYAAFTVAEGLIEIVVDTSLAPAVVSAGVWDMELRSIFTTQKLSLGLNDLEIPDGATLLNPREFRDLLRVVGRPVTTRSIFLDVASKFLALDTGAVLRNEGSIPMVDVKFGVAVGLALLTGTTIQAAGAPVFNLLAAFIGPAASLGVVVYDHNGIDNDWCTGGVGSTLSYLQVTPEFVLPTLSAPPTTVNGPTLLHRAAGVSYDDSPVSPQLGASNDQDAIDQLKPKNGATAARPASPYVGQFYLDTDLGPKPIWWTGAVWVDATGTPA